MTNRIRSLLARDYPMGVPLFVSGGGTPDPRFTGSYWLQCSLLFPLPVLPAPIAALTGKAQLKVKRGTTRPLDNPLPSPNGDHRHPVFVNAAPRFAPTTTRPLEETHR